jgi:hypothetical protein
MKSRASKDAAAKYKIDCHGRRQDGRRRRVRVPSFEREYTTRMDVP